MKNIIAARLFLLFGTLTACQKTTTEQQEALTNRVSGIQRLQTVESQKIAFRLLSAAEKAELWKTHLITEISTGEYPPPQIVLMQEAISFLTPTVFGPDSAFWKSDKFTTWKYKVNTTFSQQQKALLFNSISRPIEVQSVALVQRMDNEPSICECHAGDSGDFCGKRNVVDICFTSVWKCNVKYKCAFQGPESGCGWLWTQSCDGQCDETTIVTC